MSGEVRRRDEGNGREGEVGRGRRMRDSEEKRTRGMQQCKKATNNILSSCCTPLAHVNPFTNTFKNTQKTVSLTCPQAIMKKCQERTPVTVDW